VCVDLGAIQTIVVLACTVAVMGTPQNEPRVGVHVRLPRDSYERLKTAAVRDHRSINGQAQHYIERALAAETKRGNEDPEPTPRTVW